MALYRCGAPSGSGGGGEQLTPGKAVVTGLYNTYNLVNLDGRNVKTNIDTAQVLYHNGTNYDIPVWAYINRKGFNTLRTYGNSAWTNYSIYKLVEDGSSVLLTSGSEAGGSPYTIDLSGITEEYILLKVIPSRRNQDYYANVGLSLS